MFVKVITWHPHLVSIQEFGISLEGRHAGILVPEFTCLSGSATWACCELDFSAVWMCAALSNVSTVGISCLSQPADGFRNVDD